MFQCLAPMHDGTITFRGNHKRKITGVGNISINPYPPIDDVIFVKGLKYNLFSISQLCDSGLDVSFNKEGCVYVVVEDIWNKKHFLLGTQTFLGLFLLVLKALDDSVFGRCLHLDVIYPIFPQK